MKTDKKVDQFLAELIILCDRYFGPIKTAYDIQNIFEDYCKHSNLSQFSYDGEKDKELKMVEEARKLIAAKQKSEPSFYPSALNRAGWGGIS